MKTEINKDAFSLFINSEISCQLENGPTIKATVQSIVYKGKDDKWSADLEILGIDEIVFMGVSITDYKEVKTSIEYFKGMGINLYDVVEKEFREVFDMSGNVEQFVFEQTGINLK